MIVGSYGFSQTILRLPLGIWSDYLGHKKVFILAGLATALVSALGLMLTRQVWIILMLRSLAGVAASFWIQMTALYMNYNADDSTNAVNHLNFVNSAGQIMAIFFGGQVIARWGYQSGFGLGALFAGAGFLLCLLLPSDRPEKIGKTADLTYRGKDRIKLDYRDRGLLWGSVFGAISQYIVYSTIQGFVPQHAINLGATASQVGVMSTLNAVARVLAIFLAGKFLLRLLRPKQILVTSMVLNAPLILVLPLVRSISVLVAIMFLMGMCAATQMTYLMDAATSHIAPERRSTAMGFYQAVYGIGMVLGPAVTGFIADTFNLSTGFISIGLITSLGAVVMIWKLPDRAAIRRTED